MIRRRTLVWMLVAMLALIVSILVQPVVTQEISFESHRSEIAELLGSATPAEQKLPQPLHDLLLLSMGGHSVRYAAHLLIQHVEPQSIQYASEWNITYASWCVLVALHFSEQERLALIAHLAPTGGGHYGLDSTAQALFGHPLQEVSLAEAGTLAVLTKAPFLYNKPDQLTAERNRLLSKYRTP